MLLSAVLNNRALLPMAILLAPTWFAPKAFVPHRVIDLTIPGAWSEEQERLAQDALAAAAPSADEIFDQQLAEQAVERLRVNRAANE